MYIGTNYSLWVAQGNSVCWIWRFSSTYLLHGHGHSARELAHCKQLINPRGLTDPRLLDKLLEASSKVREKPITSYLYYVIPRFGLALLLDITFDMLSHKRYLLGRNSCGCNTAIAYNDLQILKGLAPNPFNVLLIFYQSPLLHDK